MKSLQQRLTVALSISLISVFMALWWLTDSTLKDMSEKYVIAHLVHESENVLAATRIDKTDKITLDTEQIDPAYLRPFSGQYYQLYSDNEVLRSRSLWDQDLLVPTLAAGEKRRLYLPGPQQQPLLVMASGHNKHNRTITVAVAEDLSPTLTFIEPFQFRYLLIALTLFLLLIIAQIVILRDVFQPLKRIQRQVNTLKQGKITRLDADAVPKEISLLVDEVNGLLHALEQPMQGPHNNSEDLKLALKPPLNPLQQLSDEKAIPSESETSHPLPAQTANSEYKLEPDFLAGTNPSIIKSNIEQEILTLISALQSRYRDKALDISFTMPQTDVLLLDSEELLELSGNLLKNACKWAQSKVRLNLKIDESIYLKIEDDGPGIVEHNTQVNSSLGDYRLGLTTAQSIAEQHGAQLKFRRSRELGGSCVEVVLPLTEPL